MTQRQFATVLDGMAYLESPRWHDDRIWVSDFYTGEVLSVRADGSDRRLEATVPRLVVYPEDVCVLGFVP